MKKHIPLNLILFTVILGIALLIVVFSWRGGSERYLITGSSTVAPIVTEIAALLEAEHPNLKIDVQTGGSTRGIVDTRDGESAAGMASRELTQEEAQGIAVHRVAYDGIAIILNKENPVDALSKTQVQHLFTKEFSDWRALDGQPGDVHVVNKAEGRATLDVFLAYFELRNRDIKPDAVIGDNAQGVRLVAGNPHGVGYVSISEAMAAIERDEAIKIVALDGVVPTQSTIADGTYPLRRQLNLLFRGKADAIGQEILATIHSEVGHAVVQKLGFVTADTSTSSSSGFRVARN